MPYPLKLKLSMKNALDWVIPELICTHQWMGMFLNTPPPS